ncbi:30S ribosomal protein S6 [Pseudobacteriovorax antillogorgiicola]|uniref:Small ribosomal subunit protein bS6 n=1 Tax=Pseudobacteriovorax antillogorgiicola TaxID=1513793 RepID=A0A1Y6B3L0_9BACT|nr:30S ribosomal protein S6 [Pseudobacteriovorax antillogorgiicola]TCS59283.1 small subunit ribosomal protein S6 [Pseudobacteriovorax antillogorgiicola]SME89764.1 small subunit ribosomal protein S6 [Pseudobacteriovorax antillogorgiicola]
MLREYEFTFVTKADLPDADKTKVLSGYEEILARNGGEILKKSDWGTKKLAYPIKKNFRGHYAFYDLTASPDSIAECERLLRIDENVLRYLVVKIDEDVNVEERRAELAKLDAQQSEEK